MLPARPSCLQFLGIATKRRLCNTVVSHKYTLKIPFATLALAQSAGEAYTWDATFSLAITPSLDREMFSVFVDAGFVLALPFHHRDCVGVSTKVGQEAYARDKNTSARLCAINARGGGLMREGGIFVGHNGITLTTYHFLNGFWCRNFQCFEFVELFPEFVC